MVFDGGISESNFWLLTFIWNVRTQHDDDTQSDRGRSQGHIVQGQIYLYQGINS